MKRFLALIAPLFVCASAQAHFLWAYADSEHRQMRLEIAESPGVSVAPLLGQLKNLVEPHNIGDLAVQGSGAAVSASLLKGSTGAAGLLYGVHENYLVHWIAKGATDLAGATKPMGLTAEILVRSAKVGYVLTVVKNGKPRPNAQIELYAPGDSKAVEMKTDTKGEAAIAALPKGLVAIGAIITETASGDYNGKHFVEKRDYCSLTFRV